MNDSAPTHRFPQLAMVRDASGPRIVGQSASITNEQEEAALKWAVRLGPVTVALPFVVRSKLIPGWSALALVKPVSADATSYAVRMIVGRSDQIGDIDPFEFQRHRASGHDRGPLPDFEWAVTRHPRLNVETIAAILQTHDAPLLLGVVQALLDGGKVALAMESVTPTFAESLWQLLPWQTRRELTLATQAGSTELNTDLVIVSGSSQQQWKGFLSAEQCRDYPEGRYELALQRAAEAGDQAEIDRLFNRKSSNQVLRMVIAMIAFAFFVIVILKFI